MSPRGTEGASEGAAEKSFQEQLHLVSHQQALALSATGPLGPCLLSESPPDHWPLLDFPGLSLCRVSLGRPGRRGLQAPLRVEMPGWHVDPARGPTHDSSPRTPQHSFPLLALS